VGAVYRFSVDERERAEFLVQNYEEAALALAKFVPRAELKVLPGGPRMAARLRWLAVGEKSYHPVYLFVHYDQERGVFFLINRPKYPAYLLGFVGAMVSAGLSPALLVDTGGDLRALVAGSREKAVEVAREGLRRGVVSGRRFLDYPDISFEGYLYELPVGRLAFLNPKPPLRHVDFIRGHEEPEWWVHPLDIARNAFNLLVLKMAEGAEKEGGLREGGAVA